ncbi:MAG: hypothetical protein OEZ01_15880 [Candidatus Heimdallarchaeota archaeon]|nr:hypothetical protein [Candidatus Heimdallarchaeota archaeon]MDH5647490.1 hypothetical protein [Candidatus Heimdallarchaeota archaeon]
MNTELIKMKSFVDDNISLYDRLKESDLSSYIKEVQSLLDSSKYMVIDG